MRVVLVEVKMSLEFIILLYMALLWLRRRQTYCRRQYWQETTPEERG